MNWTTDQQDALLNVIQRRNERTILLTQLNNAQAELAKQQQEQAVWLDQWQHEQADVDRLNKLSWASLYYELLNQKEQQLSKEEAEAQQAKLRYDAICATVNALQQQIEQQQKQLAALEGVDNEYDALIQYKRNALLNSPADTQAQYQHRLKTLSQAHQYVQELQEAESAGLQALDQVMYLRKLLEQAQNWGRWDMLGGSALSSLMKYKRLDEVRDQSYRVTQSLQQFRAEYADLNQHFMTDWNFDRGTTRFVDIFFDNIFTDWQVQSRINEALQTAQALENQLLRAIVNLKQQFEQATEQAKQQSDEIQRFLETV